ncbi:hypothetical protein [Paraburkholderia sp. BL17N1]|uniref:hypothetical protein n=1 Tax=Paraburkholderia sp. BL17N1 TaxID=1938798 RepID=UPI000F243EB2|nr:hypothetical protein [Paraburkholderia sp. BL17N1]RKR43214.1 hypothetical protein B0G82_0767 [Paraburkholderia sp. BL17N1]
MKLHTAAGQSRDLARLTALATCAGALSLAACSSTILPTSNAVDVAQVSKVQAEVKRQVGDYLLYTHKKRLETAAAAKQVARAETQDAGDECVKGMIDFHIDSLKLELKTTLTNDTTTTLHLPIAASVATFGPSFDGTKKRENAQTISFYEYPVPDGYYPSLFAKEPFENREAGAAISTLLIALHEGLVSARRSTPCLSGLDYTTNEQKNENTYVIGLTITDSIKPGFTVGVGPVTFVDASHDRTVMNDNTLTVTFRQIDLDTLPRVSSKAVPHQFPVVVYSAHHALAVKPGQAFLDALEISDSSPATFSRGRKAAPQAAQEKQVFTLCRDDNYFTYWCVNKNEKVGF